ncbi:MAG: hypothetical protein H7Y60_13495 [Rhodospirillaceae bacterium]|nr:hypothetical protein [Rhodospirillales bacterium]
MREAAIRHRLEGAMGARPTLLLSVDVFDTLLLRTTKPELVRFAEAARWQEAALRRHGFPSCDADALLAARLSLTKAAYDCVRTGEAGEVRFTAILADICARLGLDAACVPVLVDAELAYEKTRLSPNLALMRVLADVGVPMVATSDTPLSAAHVAVLLDHFLPGHGIRRIHASSDAGVTKRAGLMYVYISQQENVAPEGIVHVGDHPWSDCRMALEQGVRAVHLPRPALWRLINRWRDKLNRRQLRRRGLIK